MPVQNSMAAMRKAELQAWATSLGLTPDEDDNMGKKDDYLAWIRGRLRSLRKKDLQVFAREMGMTDDEDDDMGAKEDYAVWVEAHAAEATPPPARHFAEQLAATAAAAAEAAAAPVVMPAHSQPVMQQIAHAPIPQSAHAPISQPAVPEAQPWGASAVAQPYPVSLPPLQPLPTAGAAGSGGQLAVIGSGGEEWAPCTVTGWNEERGFGFVVFPGGAEAYVHAKAFGGGRLEVGSPAEAVVGPPDPGGPEGRPKRPRVARLRGPAVQPLASTQAAPDGGPCCFWLQNDCRKGELCPHPHEDRGGACSNHRSCRSHKARNDAAAARVGENQFWAAAPVWESQAPPVVSPAGLQRMGSPYGGAPQMYDPGPQAQQGGGWGASRGGGGQQWHGAPPMRPSIPPPPPPPKTGWQQSSSGDGELLQCEVTSWNHDKGFGFVKIISHPEWAGQEAFAHAKVFGGGSLIVGGRAEVALDWEGNGNGKPRVTHIRGDCIQPLVHSVQSDGTAVCCFWLDGTCRHGSECRRGPHVDNGGPCSNQARCRTHRARNQAQ